MTGGVFYIVVACELSGLAQYFMSVTVSLWGNNKHTQNIDGEIASFL